MPNLNKGYAAVNRSLVQSDRWNGLSWGAQSLYVRILLSADGAGRIRWDHARGNLYAAILPRAKPSDLAGWLDELVEAELATPYVVSGRSYVELRDFYGGPRPLQPEHPEPDLSTSSEPEPEPVKEKEREHSVGTDCTHVGTSDPNRRRKLQKSDLFDAGLPEALWEFAQLWARESKGDKARLPSAWNRQLKALARHVHGEEAQRDLLLRAAEGRWIGLEKAARAHENPAQGRTGGLTAKGLTDEQLARQRAALQLMQEVERQDGN